MKRTKVWKQKNSPPIHLKLKSTLVLFWFQSLKFKRSVLFELVRKYSPFPSIPYTLLFRAWFKWRLRENRFVWVFGLLINFMVTNPKAKGFIFISRTPKRMGYPSILNKSRRYLYFRALLRYQFGPIWNSSLLCLKQQCTHSHQKWLSIDRLQQNWSSGFKTL